MKKYKHITIYPIKDNHNYPLFAVKNNHTKDCLGHIFYNSVIKAYAFAPKFCSFGQSSLACILSFIVEQNTPV